MTFNNNRNRTSFLPGTKHVLIIMILFFVCLCPACKKFVEVDSLTDKLLASQVFGNDATANSAIAGIYRSSRDNLNLSISLFNSLAGDDIVNYSPNTLYDDYRNNSILPNNTVLPWTALYSVIYQANSAIEGLTASTGMSSNAKTYYTGEAKFNRAFAYFYLVNLFGDVPLILNSNVQAAAQQSRTDANTVYAQIVSDLKDAQTALGNDYSFTGGDRNRANKWVATALLAKVYLYQKDWINAETQSTAVINSGLYNLLNSPAGIFVKNNSEIILQWANNTSDTNPMAAYFIFTASPSMICSSFLLNAFEAGDLRKSTWIKSGIYQSQTLYYPYKFTSTAIAPNECYTVMRLSEQYMIRAEARAMQGNFNPAIDDINLVRSNHGGLKTPLNVPTSINACMDIIMRERQVDLFTEGCNRWFDLKRTGRIDAVMLTEKPSTWKTSDALYPIPLGDIQNDPGLSGHQNPGYQ